MSELIYKNNELENEVSLDMSYFWYSDGTYTLICIWTLTGGFICWILKHYLLIPDDDIPSDLDLSGCNINIDNEEEEESYTKLIQMFLEIQFDHKQQFEQREIIDINGVGRLYPFKISVSPRKFYSTLKLT